MCEGRTIRHALSKAVQKYRMESPTFVRPKALLALLALTLLASALHFADNVIYFDDYPEPAWLSPVAVAVLWLPLAWVAMRAWHCVKDGEGERGYLLVHGFISGNLLSLGHYLFAAPWEVATRINVAIAVQVGMAALLLATTLRQQARHAPATLAGAARVWVENIGLLVLLVLGLEWFWPSKFSLWWLPSVQNT